MDVFERRYSLLNWPEELRSLRKGCLEHTANHPESIASMTSKELIFLDALFNSLEMDLINVEYFRRTNKIDYFVTRLMCYLQPLVGNRKRLQKSFHKFNDTIRTVCFINHEQLPDGDLPRLFGCILDFIIESLHRSSDDC